MSTRLEHPREGCSEIVAFPTVNTIDRLWINLVLYEFCVVVIKFKDVHSCPSSDVSCK